MVYIQMVQIISYIVRIVLMYFKMCACILKWQLLINSGKEECIQIADTKLTNYSNCVHLWLDLGSLTVNLVMGVS